MGSWSPEESSRTVFTVSTRVRESMGTDSSELFCTAQEKLSFLEPKRQEIRGLVQPSAQLLWEGKSSGMNWRMRIPEMKRKVIILFLSGESLCRGFSVLLSCHFS